MGLYFPDSSSATRAPPWAPVHIGVGFQDGQWAVGELFGTKCWYETESWGRSPSPPITQSVSTLAYAQAVTHLFAVTHSQRQDLQATSGGRACLLGLTSCPPALGTEEAESVGRATVGNREGGWGSDLGKWGMGASELSFRDGSQTGIRDQARNQGGGVKRKRQRDGGDCPNMPESLLVPLPNDS